MDFQPPPPPPPQKKKEMERKKSKQKQKKVTGKVGISEQETFDMLKKFHKKAGDSHSLKREDFFDLLAGESNSIAGCNHLPRCFWAKQTNIISSRNEVGALARTQSNPPNHPNNCSLNLNT